jgi:tRNA(Arg) A34 adenosine deaminase TadA
MTPSSYDYNLSTLNPEEYLCELNREVQGFCNDNPLHSAHTKEQLISMLLRRAETAALQAVSRLEGGPFGAMLVDFHTPNGIPQVVGFGTNHVVLTNDPSGHAEMTSIRDAAKRLGRSDLSGLTLVTSCECCPMCLSAATGCKIDTVYFAATRQDAAQAGFCDADQYRLMTAGGIEQHAQKAHDAHAVENTLANHDAMVLVHYKDKKHAYYGDYASAHSSDPTDLPVIQAIKNACAGLAELRSNDSGKPQNVFHFPEDTLLISRDMPHPISLAAADWARIGRVHGQDPKHPEQDSPHKNTSRILYLNDTTEAMTLRDSNGAATMVAPQRIWNEIAYPSAIHLMGNTHTVAFEEWDRLVKSGLMPRY